MMDHQPIVALLSIATAISLIVFNFFGAWVARYFSTMFFLDTVGTAIAGLKFGMWPAVVIAVISQFLIGKLLFYQYLKFFYVTAVSGLIWGVIKERYSAPSGTDITLIFYIFAVGGIVGLISTILSVPLRIFLLKKSQNTDHLFDSLDQKIFEDNRDNEILAWTKIFCSELLLGHLPDRILSTIVGVLVVVVTTLPSDEKLSILTTMYHDHIEFLAAYYYVALAFLVKAFSVKPDLDPIIILAGPLGFFSLLLAFPTLLRLAIPLIELMASQ